FSALDSFAYNLGCPYYKNTSLLKKLNSGNIKGAANEFRLYNKSNGKVMNGLVKRREAERALFCKSESSHNNTTSFQESSIADLLELFLTLARAKETLKEMNTLLLLEIVVFTTNSNIFLTPDCLSISTDDDDLILDIRI
ncbi:27419_t:CDS:2, partial [Racocetra persica]